MMCSGGMAVYPVIIALELLPASHVIQAQESTALIRPSCFKTTMRLPTEHRLPRVARSRSEGPRSDRASEAGICRPQTGRTSANPWPRLVSKLHLALSFRFNIASHGRSQGKQQHAGNRRCVSRWGDIASLTERAGSSQGRHSTPRALKKCHEGCWWICGIIREHGWLDRLVPDKTTGQDVVQVDQALMVCG